MPAGERLDGFDLRQPMSRFPEHARDDPAAVPTGP